MRKYQNNETSFSGRLPFHKDLGSFYFEDLARIFPNKEMLCRSLGCFHRPFRNSSGNWGEFRILTNRSRSRVIMSCMTAVHDFQG